MGAGEPACKPCLALSTPALSNFSDSPGSCGMDEGGRETLTGSSRWGSLSTPLPGRAWALPGFHFSGPSGGQC